VDTLIELVMSFHSSTRHRIVNLADGKVSFRWKD
jgi:hypothetical protein